MAQNPQVQRELLEGLSEEAARALLYEWEFWARPNQLPPDGPWNVWGLVAGRGFGKTRSGSEFVRKRVYDGARSIALIGETPASCRDLMVDGKEGSSILEVFPPDERPVYYPGRKTVEFHTGAEAHIFSSHKPDAVRGWQGDTFWADELASWKHPQDTWDMLMLGFRSPNMDLRGCFTTTPKPIGLLEELLTERDDVPVTSGTTYENRANLNPQFYDNIVARYEGTQLGRQELLGVLLAEREEALWKRLWLEGGLDEETGHEYTGRMTPAEMPELEKVVVGIDPAASHGDRSDETGIIMVGRGLCDCRGEPEKHLFVLADASGRYTPAGWANKAVKLYERSDANRIIGERNNGGEMVEHTIRTVDGGEHVAYKSVWASRGKRIRAEPVSTMYEQGKAHHVGTLEQLEGQMVTWVPGEGDSPDRVDALVWAAHALFPLRGREPERIEPVHY